MISPPARQATNKPTAPAQHHHPARAHPPPNPPRTHHPPPTTCALTRLVLDPLGPLLVQVLHDMRRVNDGDQRIEAVRRLELVVDEERLQYRRRVGQPGGLDQHRVEARAAAARELAQDADEVAAHWGRSVGAVDDGLYGEWGRGRACCCGCGCSSAEAAGGSTQQISGCSNQHSYRQISPHMQARDCTSRTCAADAAVLHLKHL